MHKREARIKKKITSLKYLLFGYMMCLNVYLLQIWEMTFGPKAKLLFMSTAIGQDLKLMFRQDFEARFGHDFEF